MFEGVRAGRIDRNNGLLTSRICDHDVSSGDSRALGAPLVVLRTRAADRIVDLQGSKGSRGLDEHL